MKFVYAVWFEDTYMNPEDQDREWPACIVIEADSPDRAQEWGDFLAKRYAVRSGAQNFLWSEVRPVDDPMYADVTDFGPHVQYGEDATDATIGW